MEYELALRMTSIKRLRNHQEVFNCVFHLKDNFLVSYTINQRIEISMLYLPSLDSPELLVPVYYRTLLNL